MFVNSKNILAIARGPGRLWCMENLGKFLRDLRKRKGLTLKQVEKAGVASNAYLSQLERGLRKSPHPEILNGLASLYGVQVKDLMIAAGYLPKEPEGEPSAEAVETAYRRVNDHPLVTVGTRRRHPKLTLPQKRYLVEVVQALTGEKLL
jgi:transcriptional regulator with XRE-family HTH domain